VSGSSRIDWPPMTWNPMTGGHRIWAGCGHGDGVQPARPQGRRQGLDELASRLRLDTGAVGS
jgi:protein gp37